LEPPRHRVGAVTAAGNVTGTWVGRDHHDFVRPSRPRNHSRTDRAARPTDPNQPTDVPGQPTDPAADRPGPQPTPEQPTSPTDGSTRSHNQPRESAVRNSARTCVWERELACGSANLQADNVLPPCRSASQVFASSTSAICKFDAGFASSRRFAGLLASRRVVVALADNRLQSPRSIPRYRVATVGQASSRASRGHLRSAPTPGETARPRPSRRGASAP
jgi:hypothetical protein